MGEELSRHQGDLLIWMPREGKIVQTLASAAVNRHISTPKRTVRVRAFDV